MDWLLDKISQFFRAFWIRRGLSLFILKNTVDRDLHRDICIETFQLWKGFENLIHLSQSEVLNVIVLMKFNVTQFKKSKSGKRDWNKRVDRNENYLIVLAAHVVEHFMAGMERLQIAGLLTRRTFNTFNFEISSFSLWSFC